MEKAADKELAAVEEGRKRKISLEESSEVSSSSVQFKTRRLDADTPDNSASSVGSGNSTTCQSVNSGDVLASCCSSSRLSELAKDNSKSADLEQENEVTVEFFAASAGRSVDFTHRRENRPLSNEAEPQSGGSELTPMPPHDSNHPRRRSTAKKMPSEAELEEFFAAAEKNLQKQFIDKYNYDIVRDEPMEGRYEWVPIQLNPSCSMKKKKKKALTI